MLRIISGEFKNRRLFVPPESITRPTSHRLREAIFSSLYHRKVPPFLRGSVFLDAFAGSGAMGLEAISLGASQSLFFEKNPHVISILKRNIQHLGVADRCQIFHINTLNPPQAQVPADILFCDPPYEMKNIALVCNTLLNRGWIHAETLILYEADKKTPQPEIPGFPTETTKHFGNSQIFFLHRPSE